MHKPMGPDEMHPRVLRELTDEVAKPLSIVLEKSWQSGEVPTDWKRGRTTPLLKREKRKTQELQAIQPHLCAWQDHGVDPPGNYGKACQN